MDRPAGVRRALGVVQGLPKLQKPIGTETDIAPFHAFGNRCNFWHPWVPSAGGHFRSTYNPYPYQRICTSNRTGGTHEGTHHISTGRHGGRGVIGARRRGDPAAAAQPGATQLADEPPH